MESLTQIPAVIRIDPADNVVIALRAIGADEHVAIAGQPLHVTQAVERGHKVAIQDIAAGEQVRRYGWPIGTTTQPIAAGAHVHSHNLRTNLRAEEPYSYAGGQAPKSARPSRWTFEGCRRAGGSVGTRNQIWVIPKVGCVARTADRIAAQAAQRHAGRVDDVLAFPHPLGCSQLGDDLDGTARVLASLACNPNAGGVLLIGLGCEENQLAALLDRIPTEQRTRIRSVGA
jgi:altronate hydrolase